MLIKSHQADSTPSIELTPMIDMVFLLLIFFLVATTFQEEERELKIALPQAAAAGPISSAMREIIVNVTADGTMIVGGKSYDSDTLKALIDDALVENPKQKVTIRGDRQARYEYIVQPLDICKQAGIQEPYLDTVLVGKGG